MPSYPDITGRGQALEGSPDFADRSLGILPTMIMTGIDCVYGKRVGTQEDEDGLARRKLDPCCLFCY